jgi:alpha,alpha-trehalase
VERIDESLGEVFTDLTTSGLWHDEKPLADAVMRDEPAVIQAAYRDAKAMGPVDLQAFFARWFTPVGGAELRYSTRPNHSALDHIEALWPHLTRPADDPSELSTRFPLPHPYVVVGGRFQEAYYWDSYFTQLGLLKSGRHALTRDMLDNFAHAIRVIGHIPNGFRSYFLTRSQPPFFAQMVAGYGTAMGDRAGALAAYLPEIEAEYAYFCAPERTVDGLTRYWDAAAGPRTEMLGTDLRMAGTEAARPGFWRDLRAACESGWDFSSRWLADPMDLATIRTTQILPVDLNSLMLGIEDILAEAAPPLRAEPYRAAAEARRHALQTRFFNPERGYFFDLSADTLEPLPNITAAAFFPLWLGAATQDQAEATAAFARRHLFAPGGLLTTNVTSGQQWDAPNGWAPLNWVAIQGLRRYGLLDDAETLRSRWLATCDAVFRASGKFVEKYNVLDPLAPSSGGEYALQDGFGWSNGVYLDLS